MPFNHFIIRFRNTILAALLLVFLFVSSASYINSSAAYENPSISEPYQSISLTDSERKALIARALLRQRYLPFQDYGYIFAQNAPCTSSTSWFQLTFFSTSGVVSANACAGAAVRLLEAANLIDLSETQTIRYGWINATRPNSLQIEDFTFPDDLCPGDIIYWSNYGGIYHQSHYAVFLGIDDDSISVFAGNVGGKIKWNGTYTVSQLLSESDPTAGAYWVLRHNLNVDNLITPNPQNPVNPFLDVAEGAFYYDAVVWAYNQSPQITRGISATSFSPETTVKRCDAVTFLWAAAGKPEPSSTENPFTDVSSDQYYYRAVLWAKENGITSGTGNGTTFSPNETVKRNEMLVFLWRFAGSEEPTAALNPFSDVSSTSYYYKAALWAYSNGILVGNEGNGNPGLLNPDTGCSRAYVVSYLYNLFHLNENE